MHGIDEKDETTLNWLIQGNLGDYNIYKTIFELA